MENFSLTDLAWILGSVIAFAVACIVMPPLFCYGPRVIVSLFYRFVYVDFDTLMSRLADLGGSGEMGTSSEGGSAGSRDPVPPHRNHQEPEIDANWELGREPNILRQYSRTERIIILATQKEDDGSYTWSANKITEFVGGRAAEVKEDIAAVRGKKTLDPPARSIRRTPSGEWEPVK